MLACGFVVASGGSSKAKQPTNWVTPTGVKVYGAASAGKHATLRARGAIPIDYRAGKLDLDRMISRRIKIGEVNDAMREMEKGNVVRQVIEF